MLLLKARLNRVAEELKQLNPIVEKKFVMDLIVDNEDEPLGISIKSTEEENHTEIFWIEVLEDKGLEVKVHPEVTDEKVNPQEVWTILYCLSANMKREDEHIWGNIDTSEIAEEVYSSRQEDLNKTTEGLENNLIEALGKRKEGPTEKEVIEPPKEIELTIDTDLLTDIVLSYEDQAEAEVVIEFINTLAELSGLDFKMGFMDEYGKIKEVENLESETTHIKEVNDMLAEMGILEPNYVISNLSTLINQHLELDEKINKDKLIFLNQLVYERLKIEELLEKIFLGDD